MTLHRTRTAVAWDLIIPVKDTGLAKTRLTPFSQPDRAMLALAFVLDAAVAALECSDVRRVVAVTNDRAAGRALAGLGVVVLADAPAAGINPAVSLGLSSLREQDSTSAVAALCGDLPALRSTDLSAAFTSSGAAPSWFVADAAGSGTTMLAAGSGAALQPAFGPGSADRHREGGAADLAGSLGSGWLAGLRRDVDTLGDLYDARRLGVGAYTRAALGDIEAA